MKPGDTVRDVYTEHVGVVVRLQHTRVTVRMPTYTVIGCQSWFDLVELPMQ
jgi:hypothetical protein